MEVNKFHFMQFYTVFILLVIINCLYHPPDILQNPQTYRRAFTHSLSLMQRHCMEIEYKQLLYSDWLLTPLHLYYSGLCGLFVYRDELIFIFGPTIYAAVRVIRRLLRHISGVIIFP